MSFDVNVLSSKPVIKPAANMQNDGGGGNLGYMFQGRNGKKEETKNIFEMDCPVDTFGNRPVVFELEDEKFSLFDYFLEIIESIKALLHLK